MWGINCIINCPNNLIKDQDNLVRGNMKLDKKSLSILNILHNVNICFLLTETLFWSI